MSGLWSLTVRVIPDWLLSGGGISLGFRVHLSYCVAIAFYC